jgi:GDP-L-fucose synthase
MAATTNGSSSHSQKGTNVDPNRPFVCLVTGGTGLVGRALQWVIENETVGSRYGKQRADEEWIFLSSKDGDLKWVPCSPCRSPVLRPS